MVVVDTPTFDGTANREENMYHEIAKVISLIVQGPHVFLIAVPLPHITKDDLTVIEQLSKIFGPDALKYSICVFTHLDCLHQKDMKIDQLLLNSRKVLLDLIKCCDGRYIAVASTAAIDEKEATVANLLTLIKSMIDENGGHPNTSKICELVKAAITTLSGERVGGFQTAELDNDGGVHLLPEVEQIVQSFFCTATVPVSGLQIPTKGISEIERILTIICLDVTDSSILIPELIEYTKTFDDPLLCIACITSIRNKNIFFITSGLFYEYVIPLIHGLPQIVSIYIFEDDRQKEATVRMDKNYFKLSNIFHHKDLLLSKLWKDVLLTIFSVHPGTNTNIDTNHTDFFTKVFIGSETIDKLTMKTLNKQQVKFIFFQLLTDAVLRTPTVRTANNCYTKMLEIYRSQYLNDEREMQIINEFEPNYSSEMAIQWYEQNQFLRQSLNIALRTENMSDILHFRYFIADIHRQLVEHCLPDCRPFTVYGVEMMQLRELKNIQRNIGEVVLIKTFFSGTMSNETALNAVSMNIDPLCEFVLFEIVIDCTSDTASFSSIQALGYKENCDILFSPGSIFRIESVAQIPTRRIWHVRLSFTDRQLSKVKGLLEHIRNEFPHPLTLMTLGNFFCEVGEWDEAMRYYKTLLGVYEFDDDAIEIINYNIGLIYEHKGDYEVALQRYKTGLNRTIQSPSSNEADTQQQIVDSILKPPLMNSASPAILYFNLGCVSFHKLDYHRALENFEKAYNCLTDDNTVKKADILNNIGCVYYKRNDFQKALHYYERAFDRALKILPAENSLITCYLKNISAAVNSASVNK
ncbi:unnamed protein product [Didymodactylos carnosus]|uniref:AIG1-type G domain-containing protein n=1 Tax=Didymodactylos carnosus TaxID=1234261 RepID=A0A814XGV5_9BILA|nr:unnamed protein product [Didymodactylos carnosus]CAF3980222.1 unnamed protein product [Didymodactylos carnosus]